MQPREDYLAWCKKRALEYVDAGDLVNAVASMGSDLDKREDTRAHPMMVVLGGMRAGYGDIEGVREWIVGFR